MNTIELRIQILERKMNTLFPSHKNITPYTHFSNTLRDEVKYHLTIFNNDNTIHYIPNHIIIQQELSKMWKALHPIDKLLWKIQY